MIVISDTSAITALLQVGRVALLSQIYDQVIIPEAVHRELLHDHAVLPDFIHTVAVSQHAVRERLLREVDPGEAEAITLMIEKRGDLLLIDERRGRFVARREGVPVIGLLGVLLDGKRAGFLPCVAAVVDDLQRVAGFRISIDLKRRLLAAAGE